MGFRVEPDGLRQVASDFHSAASDFDASSNAIPKYVDVGASSAEISGHISDLVACLVTSAHHLDDVAGKVNATNGSYDTTENKNADRLTPDLVEATLKAEQEKAKLQGDPPPIAWNPKGEIWDKLEGK